MSNLTEIVETLDTRATTSDGLTFSIVFLEFNGNTGDLIFTPEEATLPENDLAAIALERYNALRTEIVEEHGWSPQVEPGPPQADDESVVIVEQEVPTDE